MKSIHKCRHYQEKKASPGPSHTGILDDLFFHVFLVTIKTFHIHAGDKGHRKSVDDTEMNISSRENKRWGKTKHWQEFDIEMETWKEWGKSPISNFLSYSRKGPVWLKYRVPEKGTWRERYKAKVISDVGLWGAKECELEAMALGEFTPAPRKGSEATGRQLWV